MSKRRQRNGFHKARAAMLRSLYWKRRAWLVRDACRQDAHTVPASREWIIDSGYCLDRIDTNGDFK